MRKLLVIAVAMAWLPSGLMAQGELRSQVWGHRFGAAIVSTFPGAELQPRRLAPRDRSNTLRWEHQGSEIYLLFTELESVTEAEAFLAQRTEILPLARRAVTGFGDEAFAFAPGATQRRMNLRRHKVVLEIGAPSEIALTRLAVALIDEIDAFQTAR